MQQERSESAQKWKTALYNYKSDQLIRQVQLAVVSMWPFEAALFTLQDLTAKPIHQLAKSDPLNLKVWWTLNIFIYYIYTVPKGAHAGGYALQLKFLKMFETLLWNCVEYVHGWMNI